MNQLALALQQANIAPTSPARVVGRRDLPPDPVPQARQPAPGDFLDQSAEAPWSGDQLCRELDRIKAELAELRTGNRWQDILALIHPVGEKWPELVDAGLDAELLRESAFALCRLGRYEEAMTAVRPLTTTEPDNAQAWYALGYAAYEALYAAKRDRGPMPPATRRNLIETAHRAFGHCQRLQGDSVSFFYRDAMVFKDFEDKPRQAIPLFERAMRNYEEASPEERDRRHQQRPKYIRAMYHLAACRLATGHPTASLALLDKVLREDRDRNHMSPVFKHFALAKSLHALGRPADAMQHLETAAVRAEQNEPVEYVHELAARCALQLRQIEKAASCLGRIPPNRRRPYIRWTEADVLVAQGRPQEAVAILEQAAERDRLARHKSLIRLARIHLRGGQHEQGLAAARQADAFCRERYGNGSAEARFWEAACLYRLHRLDEARAIVGELSRTNFVYPGLRQLTALLHGDQPAPGHAPARAVIN